MKNNISRKDKINFLKSMLAGNPIKLPVIFCEYDQDLTEPNIYINKNGILLNEQQMIREVTDAGNKAEIVFHEIRTYHNGQRVGKCVNINSEHASIQLPDNKRNN